MPRRLAIITGQSGSGQTTALHALEDLGWMGLGKVPLELVESVMKATEGDDQPVATVLRPTTKLPDIDTLLSRLRTSYDLEVIYLEASPAELIRRYSENRRRHPADRGQGLRQAIDFEHELLQPYREIADRIIDTTSMASRTLKRLTMDQFATPLRPDSPSLVLMSFGFKRGLPAEADLVFDARCITNPYYDPELRPLSGLDAKIQDYVLAQESGTRVFESTLGYVRNLLQDYSADGRRYLTVCVGCTGGRHRSVTIIERLAEALRGDDYQVHVMHRDIERDLQGKG